MIPAAQGLSGPMASEVANLTSRFVRARRRSDTVEAREIAIRIVGIYRQASVDIPALETYRQFLRETES